MLFRTGPAIFDNKETTDSKVGRYYTRCIQSLIDYASAVALSSFFIIEKMNAADSRQQTISTLHTAHNGIDEPHK